MKQYELKEDYQHWPVGTLFYGKYLITGGGYGYFTKDEIPGPEGGTNGLFASFVEQNSDLFKEIVNSQP